MRLIRINKKSRHLAMPAFFASLVEVAGVEPASEGV